MCSQLFSIRARSLSLLSCRYVGDLRDDAFAIFVGCGANAVAGELLANKMSAAEVVRYDEMQGDMLRILL